MLELHEGGASFVHDLYREHFLSAPDFDQVAVHERLATCFRELRPADFQLRCENALKAENELEASVLAVQALLAAKRNGQDERSLRPVVAGALNDPRLHDAPRRIARAMDLLETADAAGAVETVSSLPHTLAEVIRAEAGLVQSSALLLTRSGSDRRRALALLTRWSTASLGEADLEARLLRAELYGRALEPDKAAALELEGRLRSLLGGRSAVDLSAADALYSLERCAAAVHEPDVAMRSVTRAVEYFAGDGSETLRRPVEYYFALMNLAAEYIVAGRFADAMTTSRTLNSLVDEYEPGTFPNQDFPRSNQLLAAFRLGSVSYTHLTLPTICSV